MKPLLIGLVLIGLGYWFVAKPYFDKRDCEEMALKASIEEITVTDEPDGEARAILQREYQAKYVSNCLDTK